MSNKVDLHLRIAFLLFFGTEELNQWCRRHLLVILNLIAVLNLCLRLLVFRFLIFLQLFQEVQEVLLVLNRSQILVLLPRP